MYIESFVCVRAESFYPVVWHGRPAATPHVVATHCVRATGATAREPRVFLAGQVRNEINHYVHAYNSSKRSED